MFRTIIAKLIITISLFLSLLLSYLQINLPNSVNEKGFNTFSMENVFTHIKSISKTPHPIGSEAHSEVKDYILNELDSYGIEYRIQAEDSVRTLGTNYFKVGAVENIIARIPGYGSTEKALLIAGHYDSIPGSNGANDNGSAVSIMLEISRILKNNQLRNDVIFIFTDGEENGLLGMNAFTKHPWFKDIGVALNLESRGASGPSFMIETNLNNYKTVMEFKENATHPVSSSLINFLYRKVPHDTDFSILKEYGINGLNFAYVNDVYAYHSGLDNVSSVNKYSLNHHATNALSLVNFYGNKDFSIKNVELKKDAIFFPFLKSNIIYYSKETNNIILFFSFVLFIVTTIVGFKKKYLSFKFISSSFFSLLSIVITGVLTVAVWYIPILLKNEYVEHVVNYSHFSNIFLTGLLLFALTVYGCLLKWQSKFYTFHEINIGILAIWMLLSIISSFIFYEISYVFLWPFMANTIWGIVLFTTCKSIFEIKSILMLFIVTIFNFLILSFTFYTIYIFLTLNNLLILIVFFVFLCSVFFIQIYLLLLTNKIHIKKSIFIVSIFILIVASICLKINSQFPLNTRITYTTDLDEHRAEWITSATKPDKWTKNFFKEDSYYESLETFNPSFKSKVMKIGAPFINVEPLSYQLISDEVRNSKRYIQVKINAPYQEIQLSIKNNSIYYLAINNKKLDYTYSYEDFSVIEYINNNESGLTLNIVLDQSKRLEFRITGVNYELPSAFNKYLDIAPIDKKVRGITYVTKTYVIN